MIRSKCAWKIHALTSCSLLALAAVPSIAMADCSPNPAQAYGVTTCNGTQTASVTVPVSGATVNVNAGATVTASSGTSAITVQASPPADYQYLNATLNISGAVNGGSQSGILVYNTAGYYTSTSASITVNTGGVVQGAYGIQASGDVTQTYSAGSSVQLTNSGTISGTSGFALYAPNPTTGSFSGVNNLSGGQIGAIFGLLGYIDNAGVIDGGVNSAVTVLAPLYGYSATINNAAGGVIQSDSSAATLVFNGSSGTVANNGTITHSGAGVAIYAESGLSLTNVGGVINGDIVVGGSTSSTIDDTGGVINGSITLSGGDNRVIAGFGSVANPISGVTGSINAGPGFNVLQLNINTNTTLTSLVAAPATFSQVTYGIGPGSTLTIAPSANPTSTIYVIGLSSGAGVLVNDANIVTAGSAIAADPIFTNYSGVSVVNNGTITETSSSLYALSQGFYGLGAITNKGSILSNGGGVSVDGNNFTNSGSITASGYGLSAFDALITNSGSITSTNGVGLFALGNVGTPATNSGTVTGQSVGVQLEGYSLTNSGTISSPNVGVSLDPYSTLINAASGVVNGGVGAVLYGFTFDSSVNNSGIINGNVNLGSFPSYYGSSNTYIAQPGSVLNGNLTLGSGNDTFATSLINTGSGAFAGVTGSVTGGGLDSLRYFVTSDATAVVTLPAMFDALTYDLSGNAKLTLTAPNSPVSSIGFAGTGSVDLTANLTGAGSAAILDLTQASLQTQGSSATIAPTLLNFISRGTLTQSADDNYSAQPAVLISGSTSFINAGTIIAENTNTPYYGNNLAAISGSGTVINTGTIEVGLADAIVGPTYYGSTSTLTVVNSGSISQVAGFGDSEGVVNATSVTNTGTISTGGAAVVLGTGYSSSATLTNSGLIQSADSPAVSAGYGVFAVVENQSGGVISGQGAISIASSGVVENAGTINGDVSLGSYYYASTPNVYINNGGVLNGNLTFGGYGGAVLVPFNGVTGVTGAITTGGGGGTIAIPFTSNTTITNYSAAAIEGSSLSSMSNFTGIGIGAVGSGVTVTLANVTGGLNFAPLLFGDGAIVNNANINGATLQLGFGPLEPYSSLQFTNNANLPAGVTGVASAFINNGSIGSTAVYQTAVSLTAAAGASFTFKNTGAIASDPVSLYEYEQLPVAISISGSPQNQLFNTVSVQNSGSIIGGLSLNLISTNFVFNNTGTISGENLNNSLYYDGNDGVALGVGETEPNANASLDINGAQASLTNSGQITNGFSASIAANATTFVNSGAISLDAGPAAALSLTITGHQTNDPTQGVNGLIDQASLAVSNSGTINGAVAITSVADQVAVANTGAITAANYTGVSPAVLSALGVSNATSQAQTVSVTNSGTIASDNVISPALSVIATSSLSTAAISVTNSGALHADFGAVLTPALTTTTPATPPALTANAGLAAIAVSPTGSASSLTVTNAQGGVISSVGPLIDGSSATGQTLQGSSAGQGSAAVFATADTVGISNSGQINGGAGLALATGATTMIAGQSVVLADQYLAGAVQIVANTASLVNTASGVINGSIDLGPGADTLSNQGVINGDLHLTGTSVSLVEGANATLKGAIYAGVGAGSLTVNVNNAGTIAGNVTLSGAANQIVNSGVITGSVTFAGASTNTLILQTGGVVTGAVTASSVNGATNALVLQGAGTAANSFTNFNTLTVDGPGLWTLVGASSIGATTVAAGELEIGDAAHPGAVLASAVTVNSGGVLSGHGTIIGAVTNNGTVSPGGSIGVLTIQGNYTQTASGVLSLQVTPQGGSVLQVTGTANLGGELLLVTDPGVYRKGQEAALISAGSISGDFASAVTSNGLKLDISFQNGLAMATFANSNFSVTGGTANQRAIGAAFANYPVGVSDFDPVANAVIALPGGAAQNAALDALGGEIQADFLTVGRDNIRLMLDSVGEQLSIDGLDDADGRSAPARRVWGKVYGEFGTVNGDDGGHGYNHSLGGVVAGVQYDLGSKSVGVAVSYSHTDLSLRDLAQSGDLDAGTVAIDAEQRWGGLFLDGAASIAYDRGASVRHIDFAGVGRRATGGFDGYATGLSATTGWRLKAAFGVTLEPSVGVALSRVRQDGLIEAGATGADLADLPQAQGAAQSTVGVRFSKAFELKQGLLSLEGRVAETNELGAVRPEALESFTAAPGTNFTLGGANPGRNATVLGAGAVLDATTRLSFFGRAQISYSPRQHEDGFTLGGRLAW